MRIVINTPTGNIGRHLADKLLDAGETVTVISRSEGKVSELQARGAAVVVGSMDDPEVLQRAFAGAKAVFWVNPPPSRPDYEDWSAHTAQAAAAAAAAAGVTHAVVLSSVGAQHGRGAGPVGTLLEVELAFQRKIANVAVIRAGFFMENFLRDVPAILGGTVYSPVSGDRLFPMVATKDIADRAAAYLLARDWRGHIITGAHGPKSLTNFQAWEQISKLLGRQVAYVPVPIQAAQQAMLGFGMPEFLINAYSDMYIATTDGRMDGAEPRTPETTTPTTLKEFVLEVLLPAVEAASKGQTQA